MLVLSKAEKIIPSAQRVNIDFPVWMVKSLDNEAHRRLRQKTLFRKRINETG